MPISNNKRQKYSDLFANICKIIMHYITKFANFFINNCKIDIIIKLGLSDHYSAH